MSYEIPQNGFDFTETGKFLNPYRDYAFYFIKFVKDFFNPGSPSKIKLE
jgi:hypothetical protein